MVSVNAKVQRHFVAVAQDDATIGIESVAQHQQANEQLLYFTSSSILGDDTIIIFISDRSEHPNLFMRNIDSQQEKQLTYNTQGFLKSYVYFSGNPYRGFAKASVSLHADMNGLPIAAFAVCGFLMVHNIFAYAMRAMAAVAMTEPVMKCGNAMAANSKRYTSCGV